MGDTVLDNEEGGGERIRAQHHFADSRPLTQPRKLRYDRVRLRYYEPEDQREFNRYMQGTRVRANRCLAATATFLAAVKLTLRSDDLNRNTQTRVHVGSACLLIVSGLVALWSDLVWGHTFATALCVLLVVETAIVETVLLPIELIIAWEGTMTLVCAVVLNSAVVLFGCGSAHPPMIVATGLTLCPPAAMVLWWTRFCANDPRGEAVRSWPVYGQALVFLVLESTATWFHMRTNCRVFELTWTLERTAESNVRVYKSP